MAYFLLDITMNGVAFNYPHELTKRLRAVGEAVEAKRLTNETPRPESGFIVDVNGNTCGAWKFYPDDPGEGGG